MAPGARAALGSLLGPSDLKAAEATEAVGAAGQGQGRQGQQGQQGQGGGLAAGAPFAPGDHLERMARAAGVPAMDEGDALAFLARSWAAEMRQVTLTLTLTLTPTLTLTLSPNPNPNPNPSPKPNPNQVRDVCFFLGTNVEPEVLG